MWSMLAVIQRLACRFAVLLGLVIQSGPAFPHEAVDARLAQLTERIERQPGDPSLYLERGDLYRYRGDWSNARDDYRCARRIDPALDVVDLRMGALHLQRGHLRRAKAALDRYLERRPGDI